MSDDAVLYEFREKDGPQHLKIVYDTFPDSPRGWDNLGKMVCFHRQYSLPIESEYAYTDRDFSSWEELEQILIDREGAEVILPVYMYDHSGVALSIRAYNDRWDSGQVGFIYATRKDILQFFQKSKLTANLRKDTEKVLRGELELYDQYLNGQVYGYVLTERKHCDCCGHDYEDEVDRVYGFYDGDKDITEYIFDWLDLNPDDFEEVH